MLVDSAFLLFSVSFSFFDKQKKKHEFAKQIDKVNLKERQETKRNTFFYLLPTASALLLLHHVQVSHYDNISYLLFHTPLLHPPLS